MTEVDGGNLDGCRSYICTWLGVCGSSFCIRIASIGMIYPDQASKDVI